MEELTASIFHSLVDAYFLIIILIRIKSMLTALKRPFVPRLNIRGKTGAGASTGAQVVMEHLYIYIYSKTHMTLKPSPMDRTAYEYLGI